MDFWNFYKCVWPIKRLVLCDKKFTKKYLFFCNRYSVNCTLNIEREGNCGTDRNLTLSKIRKIIELPVMDEESYEKSLIMYVNIGEPRQIAGTSHYNTSTKTKEFKDIRDAKWSMIKHTFIVFFNSFFATLISHWYQKKCIHFHYMSKSEGILREAAKKGRPLRKKDFFFKLPFRNKNYFTLDKLSKYGHITLKFVGRYFYLVVYNIFQKIGLL